MAENTKPDTHDGEETIPFFPDHVRTEAWVALGVIGLVMAVAVIGWLAPVGLGDPADPMNTPLHIKPEWYFLGLYQLLKFVPQNVGIGVIAVGVGALFFVPFLDRKPDSSPLAARRRMIGAAVVVIVLLVLTVWGEFS